jgi:hypothetical protein
MKTLPKDKMGTTGLIFNEPLLWEKGSPGRKGMSLPRRDVDEPRWTRPWWATARIFRIFPNWTWCATSPSSPSGTSAWTAGCIRWVRAP